MTDDEIREIAEPFKQWTIDGYALFDVIAFARTLLSARKPAAQMGSIATMKNLIDTWDFYVGGGRTEADAALFIQSMNHVRELLDNASGNTECANAEMIRRLRALQRNSIRSADLNADATLSEVIAMLAAAAAAPAQSAEPIGYVNSEWHKYRRGTTTLYPESHPRVATSPLYAAPQLSRRAALEEAAKVCDELADGWNLTAQGATDGRYDFMAEAGDRCADEIRALSGPTET